MKYNLPENHGLSERVIDDLVFHDQGSPSLTDAQFDSLQAGVGRGESVLVVSPTSTGKTLIALWAITSGLEAGYNAVYLVTHRALAKQKFDEFKPLLLANYLNDDPESLVIATGDYVQNSNGEHVTDPLGSPLLIATYEKYLALLSSAGIPADMRNTVVVCDEIQLVGDKFRGQTVEVLLTLLRNAGLAQFVGLSAVLEDQDARDLSDWLGVSLVLQYTREKHLRYECWTPDGMAVVTTQDPENISENEPLPNGVGLNTLEILDYLLKTESPPTPIIVFCCARKQDTINLAEYFVSHYLTSEPEQFSFPFDGMPETTAKDLLSRTLAQRVAVHNADLMEEERSVVEERLVTGNLDVVFATATLAAGVNFPLGAAIYADWERYNHNRRAYEPIEVDEFHNMAGRVGRMGFDHEFGRIIFIADTPARIRNAKKILDLSEKSSLASRIAPERFNQLVLQLVSSGLCKNRRELEKLVFETLSSIREQDKNPIGFAQWPDALNRAIESLLEDVHLVITTDGRMFATPVGKAIGFSGLLPETASFLLNYSAEKSKLLVELLPTHVSLGDIPHLAFVLFCACFSSPEFRSFDGKPPTRFLPWPLDGTPLLDPDVYLETLPEPVWHADIPPINAAKLALDWIEGLDLRTLERSLPSLSAGMLRDMFRNLVWVLNGYSSIISALVDPTTPVRCRPTVFQTDPSSLHAVSKLPRLAKRLCYRINEGLPDDALWLMSLNGLDTEYKLYRSEILALREAGYVSPELLMLGSREADAVRVGVFDTAKPSPHAKANWLRDTCRNWKQLQRRRAEDRQLKRAAKCPNKKLLEDLYSTRGNEFEKAFENALSFLGIDFVRLDDRTKTGAPDYLVNFNDSPPLIIELKSKTGDKLVDYNGAVEVLGASEIHGYKDEFCVTLCHPGVDPSVPLVIAECGRLSVVEVSDFSEALLRICEGGITQSQVRSWLASPGQALTSDLPYRNYL